MNTTEMHIMFRQFAQQMGMQNVRAILPEQIDLLLNTSISDILDEIIRTNVGLTNDRVVTDNSKISQVNALRTLYTVKEIEMFKQAVYTPDPDKPESNGIISPFLFRKSYAYSGRVISNPLYTFPEFRFLVDFSINYINVDKNGKAVGLTAGSDNEDFEGFDDSENVDDKHATFVSNWFPVRIIDDAYLAEAQQDYVLKSRLRTPVITVYGNNYDLYIDTFAPNGADGSYVLDNGLIPYKLRMAYIKQPRLVTYWQDQGRENIDTDMPEEHHVNIVKHAVELFNDSLRGNIATEQAKQQRAQQERYRNQNRDEQTT